MKRDFGNLFLLFTMVWGYFSFSQWVIIWSGNLPDEIDYFLHRFSDGWLYVGAFIIVFQFFGPFRCCPVRRSGFRRCWLPLLDG